MFASKCVTTPRSEIRLWTSALTIAFTGPGASTTVVRGRLAAVAVSNSALWSAGRRCSRSKRPTTIRLTRMKTGISTRGRERLSFTGCALHRGPGLHRIARDRRSECSLHSNNIEHRTDPFSILHHCYLVIVSNLRVRLAAAETLPLPRTRTGDAALAVGDAQPAVNKVEQLLLLLLIKYPLEVQ